MSQPRLKLALIGLGRLGGIRARILAYQQPRIELVAVCDTKPGAEEWAKSNLPASVLFFSDPLEMMKHAGAQAVLISTATATHAELVLAALDSELHVMCEKPISVDVITTKEVLDKAATKPHLKFLVPFSRRYDDSCREAKALRDSGAFGKVHAVETAVLDKQDPSGFFVAFSAQSGGIFVDMGIHDVDIGRWFLDVSKGLKNPKKQVTRVTAMGQQAVYGDLAKYDDFDNVWGQVEFENGTVLTTHCGRTLSNGFEGTTRIFGTKASAIVSNNSAANRVEIRDEYGVRTATTPDAFALYDRSFLNDLAEFATAVLDGEALTCSPEDAYEASKIVSALQFAVRNKCSVYFDDEGLPILQAPRVNGH